LFIRDLNSGDFDQALHLYQILTRDPVPVSTSRDDFDAVLNHVGTSVIGVEHATQIIAMITLHVLPNMTSGGRPYALIENVVCDTAHRGQGIGRTVMQAGINRAQAVGAYKIMLMTGTTRGAMGFYEKSGFSNHEKHGMILRF
jgi:GNAT superfamily N-acetyltransferase